MTDDVRTLIPRHKADLQRAGAARAAGYPAIAPILPELLKWLQDFNWPVAKAIAPFLASIGAPLIPHVRHVMDSDDLVWKYWVISSILRDSVEVRKAFRDDLVRLADNPTADEKSEELDEVARSVLEDLPALSGRNG